MNGITVYLDKALSELSIKSHSTVKVHTVQLVNSLGQTVTLFKNKLNATEISIATLHYTGIYFVKLTTNKGVIVKKVLIN